MVNMDLKCATVTNNAGTSSHCHCENEQRYVNNTKSIREFYRLKTDLIQIKIGNGK